MVHRRGKGRLGLGLDLGLDLGLGFGLDLGNVFGSRVSRRKASHQYSPCAIRSRIRP